MKRIPDSVELLEKLFRIAKFSKKQMQDIIQKQYGAATLQALNSVDLSDAIESIAYVIDTLYGNKTLRTALYGEQEDK